jgi:Domain of unknown function (DUF4326)/Protein of unknown function, DUF488
MIHRKDKHTYDGPGIYCGREMPRLGLAGSVLGNPFRVGRDGTLEEVIQKYRRWLWERMKLRNEVYAELVRIAALAKQGDVTLICWCEDPKPCHIDVIRRAVEWLDAQPPCFNHPDIAPRSKI